MRQLFRYILMALILVTVFLVSALTSMRMAIHGREAAVPKLIGMTPAEASRTGLAAGLPVEVENRFYSADVPEGRILSQAPPPGTKVRRGWRVRVAESLGPQRVAISNVVGQSERAAEVNLAERGLQPGTVATIHLPGYPSPQVIAQSPPAGAENVASPKVSLLLSAPVEEPASMYVMPDFVGRHFGEASSAIAENGFRLGPVTVTPQTGSSLPNGQAAVDMPKLKAIATDTILSQSPAPGQKVAAGATITFSVVR